MDEFWSDLTGVYAEQVRRVYVLGCLYLQLDAGSTTVRVTGVLDEGASVEVRSPDSAQTLHPDAEGWFRADVRPGPVCVTVPALGLTTGWFVA